ncbi:type II CRISPR-associated endonuclease Cas1 [Staphylococcus lugdunensis]|uniref:type II CRISPR-associated endonuclease Cas1 n=1 Tax=Staphylococcus lugdunensis TaxID=28035 RepID=UPI001F57C59D|nr:type II CRISPR-associated endonuclease Cas1 [Staphylococcus lugdunensis]MCI2752472.1 type II CRISPR-associated endonuclease Cas1 [Staphylococcus lugdunensis]MCI2762422.1 type II CRISPR-associated endonuclease Cas1 [Staphylococcus lugdunensis]MCI2805966.1 type II CRISPR-associated endonuclease Cas1 [Staphylococcus lugdunensis]MCI2812998.1 type II CRISPR-associated endonuclease Cas1 [Staphylococcus lugdunensis]MCI2831938.1 type II CRISPR-associated endonuclease Cas1 [Staphylococcus lugdunensi
MSWRIVYVSDVNHMSLNLNRLKIKKGDLETKIPLADIFALVIEDLTVTITSRLLVELSNYNILVIFCNQKHLPECSLQPISGHFNQYIQMKEQLKWDEARKNELWSAIVKRKIHNQIECMKYLDIDQLRINKMTDLYHSVALFDRNNIEGQAAKYYFNSFFKDFIRDNDELIENAVLNYGYTIFNAAIARTIVAKGLIPAIGIHHIGGRNHFNLASDLIEPFRPIVDLFLLKYPPEDFLTKDYRVKLINLLHARIEIDGKMQTIIRAIEIMIQSIIEYFKNGHLDIVKFPNLRKYQFYEL